MTMDYSMILAGASLALSVFTLWRTHLHHGSLKTTKPTLIFLARDLPSKRPKIFIRTLLFSTGVRGWVIESMYLRIHQKDPSQAHIFDFWGYNDGKMTLGSGLFVKPEGIVCDHHFNPRRSDDFLWWGGEYRIEVFARIHGKDVPKKLRELSFVLPTEQAAQLIQIIDAGAFVELDAETQEYASHIERHPNEMPIKTAIP